MEFDGLHDTPVKVVPSSKRQRAISGVRRPFLTYHLSTIFVAEVAALILLIVILFVRLAVQELVAIALYVPGLVVVRVLVEPLVEIVYPDPLTSHSPSYHFTVAPLVKPVIVSVTLSLGHLLSLPLVNSIEPDGSLQATALTTIVYVAVASL